MNLECKLKTATSKDGKNYVYISIMIGTYEKKIFLDNAEKELVKLILKEPQK